MKLSILICGLSSRMQSYTSLTAELYNQFKDKPYAVEMLTEVDSGEMSIGEKRNKLLDRAKGEYVCFIDDDDVIFKNYIDHLFVGINKGVDCCSLRGVITWDGDRPQLFEHSIKYDAYRTNDTGIIKYERYPNHLNCIKSSIAKQFKFPETNHGEDTDWATQIFKSGLIKTEHFINDTIYHYQYKPTK